MNNLTEYKTCASKTKYGKARNAFKRMGQMLKSGKIFDKLGFYKCEYCGYYHITTKEMRGAE